MIAFAKITAAHDAIFLTLTPAAGQLYRWLLRAVPAGKAQEVELEAFQSSSGYSMRWIKDALNQLIEADLVEVVKKYSGKIFKLVAFHPVENPAQAGVDPVENPAQAGEVSSPFVQKTSQDVNFSSTFVQETSKIQGSNPDSVVPNNREILKKTETPTLHPVERTDKEELIKEVAETIAPVPLNPQLVELVIQSSLNTVMDALEVVKQSKNKKNPAGFLIAAIRGGWKPKQKSDASNVSKNASNIQNVTDSVQDPPRLVIPPEFNEWYNLAHKANFVKASRRDGDRILVLTNLGEWEPLENMMQLFPMRRLLEIPLPSGFSPA